MLWAALPGTALAAPPANDTVANATVIQTLPYTDTADITEATASGDDLTRCGALSNTVWYSFTPTTGLRIQASALGNDGTYTVLVAYAAVPDRTGEVNCATNSPGGPAQIAFNAPAGVVYYFAVGSSPFSPGGTPSRITLSVTQGPPPPANDEIANARAIGGLPFGDSLDTSQATTAADDPDCFGRDATVWYSFTPARDVRVQIDTFGSSYTTTVSIYTGARGSLSQVACTFSGATPGSRVRFAARAGITYYVMVGGSYTAGGQLQLSAVEAPPPPDNDEIEGARPITVIPFNDTLDTTDATTASDDPFCYGQGPTVWYSFTPAADIRLELSTYGSGYGATLSVYTGSRGSLTQLACNAFSPGPGARVRFDAQANVTYYVMVGSTYGAGSLQLSAGVAPPPFAFDMQIDRRGWVDTTTGVATVRGTAACSQPSFVYASGGLTQERPGQPIDAFLWTAFFCDGITTWSAPVYYTPRLFRGRSVALFVGGKAQATLSGSAFSPSEGEYRFVSVLQSVILTGAKPKP
jgi:hypothetical protein